MRKGLAWSIAAVLSASVLAGCGSEDPLANKGTFDPGADPHWADSALTENLALAPAGWDRGCSDLPALHASASGLTVSAGYALDGPLPTDAKHHDTGTSSIVSDGSIDGFAFAGVVLIASATENRFDEQGNVWSTPASDPVAIAKPASALEGAEQVSFEGVSLPFVKQGCVEDEGCWVAVHATFVICWDDPASGERAYHFVRPMLVHSDLIPEGRQVSSCATIEDPTGASPMQGLLVSHPLLGEHAKTMNGAPDPAQWPAWIDAALPRPE